MSCMLRMTCAIYTTIYTQWQSLSIAFWCHLKLAKGTGFALRANGCLCELVFIHLSNALQEIYRKLTALIVIESHYLPLKIKLLPLDWSHKSIGNELPKCHKSPIFDKARQRMSPGHWKKRVKGFEPSIFTLAIGNGFGVSFWIDVGYGFQNYLATISLREDGVWLGYNDLIHQKLIDAVVAFSQNVSLPETLFWHDISVQLDSKRRCWLNPFFLWLFFHEFTCSLGFDLDVLD